MPPCKLSFQIRAKFDKECQSLGKWNFNNDLDALRSIWRYNYVINRLNQVIRL